MTVSAETGWMLFKSYLSLFPHIVSFPFLESIANGCCDSPFTAQIYAKKQKETAGKSR